MVKVESTVKEIMNLGTSYDAIKNRLSDVSKKVLDKKGDIIQIPFEFSYRLSKNGKKIKTYRGEQEQPFMDKSRELNEKAGKKYREDYIKTCEKTGVKDGNNFKMIFDPNMGGQVAECIPTEVKKRDEDLDKLKKKYSDFIKERDELDEKYREMLDSDSSIELYGFKEEHLPKDLLLPHEVEILLDLIEEDSDKPSKSKASTKS